MDDEFSEVTTQSWGSRVLNSIKGVIIGFIAFIISFVLLYWNEGRADISKIARTAIEIEANSNAPIEANKKLVSVTGELQSNEKIGDTFLREGNYISITRNAEMYAWTEIKSTETKKELGGSETTKTTYKYEKKWTSKPPSSSNFKKPKGHQNPKMQISQRFLKVNNAKIGIFDLNMKKIQLPEQQEIQLDSNAVISIYEFELVSDRYLFKGDGSITNPIVGDIRISYSVLYNPIETATVFGSLNQDKNKISPFYGKKTLYRIFEGTRDGAISTMKTEHTVLTWVLRLVGFGLMWVGLMGLFGPISTILDILPIFGTITRVGIALITFVISLILSIVTIIVSMIAHSPIALVIVISSLIVGTIFYLKNKRKKQQAAESTEKA